MASHTHTNTHTHREKTAYSYRSPIPHHAEFIAKQLIYFKSLLRFAAIQKRFSLSSLDDNTHKYPGNIDYRHCGNSLLKDSDEGSLKLPNNSISCNSHCRLLHLLQTYLEFCLVPSWKFSYLPCRHPILGQCEVEIVQKSPAASWYIRWTWWHLIYQHVHPDTRDMDIQDHG